jgi:hypothetical protein
MIALALILAGSPVPQSLLDAADAVGLAQTQCLFSTFRAARQAHLSSSEFNASLRSTCSAESQQLSTVSARIFALRGESNPRGKAQRLIEESYSSMVEEYRRFPEKEKMVRDFCKADPKDCS